MKSKPIISWPGGKTRLLKHIVPHIPTAAGYVEVFAGGCAVLLAKPPSKLEVVNDINSDIVTLYRVAKHHPDALVAELQLMPGSREYLTQCVALLKSGGLTDVQRAAMFLHANKTSFCASGTSYAVAKHPGSNPFSNREALFDRIRMFAFRMSQVSIEHMDYRRLLTTYDHAGNLFFLDPPYLGADVSNYRGWTEIEMGQFQAAVLALSGRWIVTVDDSQFNRAIWKGHDIHSVVSRNGVGNQGRDPGRKFGELVIYSPGLRSKAARAMAA
jgi:DNA adenine methylase